MASSIIATTIDETFPVAGVDNDSQGFRDNFTIIKDNFTYAKDEIEDLQNNTAKVNADNSFDNNTISLVNLKETTVQTTVGTGSGNITYSWTSGSVLSVLDVATNIEITVGDWPTTDQYAELLIVLKPTDSSQYTVTFNGRNPSDAPSTYHVDNNGSADFTDRELTMPLLNTERDTVKLFTYDSGNTMYIQYLGRFTQTA